MDRPRETPIDVALVDALLRRQLAAKRRGRRIRVCNCPDELRALLELVGVGDVLLLEPRREPELGEQLRVDEVVQADDPVV